MFKKSCRGFAVTAMSAGILAFAPSLARAYHGVLVGCAPSSKTGIVATIKPGLTCNDTFNKIKLKMKIKDGLGVDNCSVDSSAPLNAWFLAKVDKYDYNTYPTLANADVQLKAIAYGDCDLDNPSPASSAIYGTGKIQFYDNAVPPVKVKGAASKFVVVPKTKGTDYLVLGVVTKGLGVGGAFEASLALDLDGPSCTVDECGPVFACTTFGCPGTYMPGTAVALKSVGGASFVRIGFPSNRDCTGEGDPWNCCLSNCTDPGSDPSTCDDDTAVGVCGK
jgi:hypothetical protein